MSTASQRRRIGVGVTSCMDHQRFPLQISCRKAGGNNIGRGGPILIHHKPAQISTMAIFEGSSMGTSGFRIPVTSCHQASNADTVGILTGFAVSDAVEVEAVLTGTQSCDVRVNDKPSLGVFCGHGAQDVLHSECIKTIDPHIQRLGLGCRDNGQADHDGNGGHESEHRLHA